MKALLALFTLALCTACGTSTITSQPDGPPGGNASQQAAAPSESPKPRGARVGDIITLKGMDPGAQVAVKLMKVINSGRPANDFTKAGDGKRLYAVELLIKNTGSANYHDSPGSGAKVVDADGQEYEASLFGEIAGVHPIGSDLTFGPDDSRRGVITFEVPAKAKITRFLFALDSGYADQKGIWATR